MNRAESRDQGSSRMRAPRRRFLGWLGAAMGGVALWPGQAAAAPDTIAPAVHRARGHLPSAMRDYPMPTYIPAGYRLTDIRTDIPDGLGGRNELTLWYHTTDDLFSPLQVFIAPEPVRRTLLGRRVGQATALSFASGGTVQAEYHDGWWAVIPASDNVFWDTRNVHSLAFRWRDRTIFVRGARMAGVGYDELLRVAGSLA